MRAILATLLLASPCLGEQIPLESVWAYKMPGTKRLTDSIKVGHKPPPERELVSAIRRSLQRMPRDDEKRTAFAVSGSHIEALQQAARLLTDKSDPPQPLTTNKPVYVFFFSHESGRYVHLSSASIDGKSVNLSYRLVTHSTQETTCHFALVPLGLLSAGEYQVAVKSLPPERPTSAKLDKYSKKLVSQGFSFKVQRSGEK